MMQILLLFGFAGWLRWLVIEMGLCFILFGWIEILRFILIKIYLVKLVAMSNLRYRLNNSLTKFAKRSVLSVTAK